MMLSEFGEKIEKAVFWAEKKMGWIKNRCTHTFPPYEKTRTIAILVHYKDKGSLEKAEKIAEPFRKEGKKVSLILCREKGRKRHPSPPEERGLLWERKTKKRLKRKTFDLLIDLSWEETTKTRRALYGIEAKGRWGSKRRTRETYTTSASQRR